ncbi:MAG: hypothetical protein JNK05_39200 [Myxococcales bacterium]|nr:hypothetical protein [Myxococcales bacterium]
MAEPRASKKATRPKRPSVAIALADALVKKYRTAPTPDPAREQAMLEAVRQCETLAEGWEAIIARGLLPGAWLDASDRRFYGVSGRCARCGHKSRCAFVRCLNDERREESYGFAPFPTSWWDMLVLVGHTARFVEAETLARERDEQIAHSEWSTSRRAWTWTVETPVSFYFALSRPQAAQVSRAIELAHEELGMPLPAGARSWIEPLFKWLRNQTDAQPMPELPRSSDELGDTGVIYRGRTLGWSELVATLAPSRDAARALPRGVPLTIA